MELRRAHRRGQDERTSEGAHEHGAPLARPRAQRLQQPSWRDGRLVVGILLVAAATVAGTLVFDRLDDSVQVYRARAALVPGQQVSAGDLEPVKVRLNGDEGRYLRSGRPPTGRVLRQVGAGELVPVAAVGAPGSVGVKAVAVSVDPTLAATLTRGSTVDVWVSSRRGQAAGSGYDRPQRLVERAAVARVPRTDSGGFSVGTGQTSSVHVLVPDAQVGDVIDAVNSEGKVTLVATADSPMRSGA